MVSIHHGSYGHDSRFRCSFELFRYDRMWGVRLFAKDYLTVKIDGGTIPYNFEYERNQRAFHEAVSSTTKVAQHWAGICSEIKLLYHCGFMSIECDNTKMLQHRSNYLLEVKDNSSPPLLLAFKLLIQTQYLLVPPESRINADMFGRISSLCMNYSLLVDILDYSELVERFYQSFSPSIQNNDLIAAFTKSCKARVPYLIFVFLLARLKEKKVRLDPVLLKSCFTNVIYFASSTRDAVNRFNRLLLLNKTCQLPVSHDYIARLAIQHTSCLCESKVESSAIGVELLGSVYQDALDGGHSIDRIPNSLKNSPLVLLASRYSLECFEYLLNQTCEWIFCMQTTDSSSYFAIHCCCLAESHPEALHLLLSYAKNKPYFAQLSSQVNSHEQSALIQIIQQAQTSHSNQLFIQLLSHGCRDTNALSAAIKIDDLFKAKALIVFEFNHSLLLTQSIHMQMTGPMSKLIQTASKYYSKLKSLEHQLKLTNKLSSSSSHADISTKLNVLCMDGGGVRGLVLVETLQIFEYCLSRDISNIFQFIAGTSTGGILACALQKLSIGKCRELYFDMAHVLFRSRSPPYDSNHFDILAVEHFGTDVEVNNMSKKNSRGAMILCTSVNVTSDKASLHYFRSYPIPATGTNIPHVNEFKGEDIPISIVLKATSAAPYFFKPVLYANQLFMDGGLLANNPALVSLSELACLNLEINAMLSLGTGYCRNLPISQMSMNERKELLTFRKLDSLANIIDDVMFAKEMKDILISTSTHTDAAVPIARAWCQQLNCVFSRIDPELNDEIPLDTHSIEKLVDMCFTARINILEKEWSNVCQLALKLKQVM